jgi:hypothetical protein
VHRAQCRETVSGRLAQGFLGLFSFVANLWSADAMHLSWQNGAEFLFGPIVAHEEGLFGRLNIVTAA